MKDNIVKYSKVRNGMSKKDKRIYNKNDNTILLDSSTYFYHTNDINYTDIKTLLIENEYPHDLAYIYDLNAEDIYVDKYANLGGITIPFDYIIKNISTIKFIWTKDKKREEIKINIILPSREVVTLNLKNIKTIELVENDKNSVYVKVTDDTTSLNYKIDSLGNKEKEYISYKIKDNNFQGEILDLREYNKYTKVYIEKLELLDKLVINKSIIKNINKYDAFNKLKYKELLILDDNEMKLFQDKYLITLDNDDTVNVYTNSNCGNFIYINGKNKKIIYIDSNDRIRFIEEEKLINEEIIETKVALIHSMFYTNYEFVIQSKLKNNTIKITSFDKEYFIDDLFKKFLLLNIDNFFPNQDKNNIIEECISNDLWVTSFIHYHISLSQLNCVYQGFIEFKKRLDKLKKIGFTLDAIKYLIDRDIYKIINNINNDFDISILDKEEIDAFNKLGEHHKIKTLSKSGGSK